MKNKAPDWRRLHWHDIFSRSVLDSPTHRACVASEKQRVSPQSPFSLSLQTFLLTSHVHILNLGQNLGCFAVQVPKLQQSVYLPPVPKEVLNDSPLLKKMLIFYNLFSDLKREFTFLYQKHQQGWRCLSYIWGTLNTTYTQHNSENLQKKLMGRAFLRASKATDYNCPPTPPLSQHFALSASKC